MAVSVGQDSLLGHHHRSFKARGDMPEPELAASCARRLRHAPHLLHSITGYASPITKLIRVQLPGQPSPPIFQGTGVPRPRY